MRVPLNWLADYVDLPAETDPHALAAEFAAIGLEEEDFFGPEITGPLVVGRVLELTKEEQSKDRYFSRVAEIATEMTEDHGKDFAMGTLVLAARWIAEGRLKTPTDENMH